MKIIFNLMNVGLNNNGGSSTLIKSSNTLTDLGHSVYLIDKSKNKYNWGPLKAKHLIIKKELDIPEADIIIGTGYNSFNSTINLPIKFGKKFIWCRGFEIWNTSENNFIKFFYDKRVTILVNSLNLQNKLKKYNIDSYLVRPGYDLKEIYPKYIRNYKNEIVLGGLYHGGKHRLTKRTDWILESTKVLKNKYKNRIKLYMFGADKNPNNSLIDKYISNPDIIDKNELYNEIDIFLSPSMREGLHIPPAEAMLTCCPVVGTNAELNGMNDYLINNKTGIVTENNIENFIKGIEILINDPLLRKVYGTEGHNKIYSIGSREKNMKELIEILNMEINK